MGLSTRELYLALRVRDEGTRNLQRFASELTRTGNAAKIASIRAQADAIREQAALKRNEAALQRETVARLRANGASQAQIRGAQARVATISAEATALEKQAKDLDRHAAAIDRDNDKLSHLTGTLTQTGIALQTIGVGFAALGAAGFAAMGQLIGVAMEYQRQVAATATQIDGFGGNLGQLAQIGRDVAAKIAIPFETIQPALFDIFSSMEVTTEQAGYLLEQFAKAAVAGQVDVQSAARATIGIMNAFSVPIEDVNRLLDLQFQLVQEGIGSYEEWNARIGSVSPSVVRANQSIETMMAALAATTRFGIPAAQSATAVARAFDAMSNPKAIEKMEELGIQVRDADGNLRPFNLVMREFRDILRSMPNEDRVGEILDVFLGAGSTIQARKFIQSILLGENGLETFDMILGEMTGATGSFDRAYNIMAETVAMKSEVISNKWKILQESIGAYLLPTFERVLDTLERVFDWFERLPDSTKGTIAQFILWGSVIAVVSGVLFILLGFMAVFISSIIATWSVMAPLVVIVGSLIAIFVILATTIGLLWAKSEPFRQFVRNWWEDFKELGVIIRDFALGLWESFEQYVMPPLKRLWDLISNTLIPAFDQFRQEIWERVKPKLIDAFEAIKSVFETAFKAIGWLLDNAIIPLFKALSEWWMENKERLMPFIDVLMTLLKWLGIIAAVIIGVVVVALVVVLGAAIAIIVGAMIGLIYLFDGLKWALAKLGEGIAWVAGKIGDFFSWLGTHAHNFVDMIGNWFTRDIPNALTTFGLGLVRIGEDLITGLINGMKNKFTEGVQALKSFGLQLLNGLKGVLGIQSPSKEMAYIGVQSALGYIEGYKRTLMSGMMGTDAFLGLGVPDFAPPTQRPVEGANMPGGALMPVSEKKVINNYITVNTQELDSREQAAKLGWELAGRM